MECITSVLNKLHAMHAAGILTLKEIAKGCGVREQRISEWVTQRQHAPAGPNFPKLYNFVSLQTLRIAMNKNAQPKYRAAYKEICLRFPVEGKK